VPRSSRQREPQAETFLWVRVARLAAEADRAVDAARSRDVPGLRAHLHQFDTPTSGPGRGPCSDPLAMRAPVPHVLHAARLEGGPRAALDITSPSNTWPGIAADACPAFRHVTNAVTSQHSRTRPGSQEASGQHEKDEGTGWFRGPVLDGHDPGVRHPVTEVGLIRIQIGRSRALAHEYRPSRLSRPVSASSSTTSARPLTRTLHPDWVMSS